MRIVYSVQSNFLLLILTSFSIFQIHPFHSLAARSQKRYQPSNYMHWRDNMWCAVPSSPPKCRVRVEFVEIRDILSNPRLISNSIASDAAAPSIQFDTYWGLSSTCITEINAEESSRDVQSTGVWEGPTHLVVHVSCSYLRKTNERP